MNEVAAGTIASLLVAGAVVVTQPGSPGGPPAPNTPPSRVFSLPPSAYSQQTVVEVRTARPIARPEFEMLPPTGDGTTVSFAIRVFPDLPRTKAFIVWKQAIRTDGTRGEWERFVDEVPFSLDATGRPVLSVPGFDARGVQSYALGVQAYLGDLPIPEIAPAPGFTDPSRTGDVSSR